MLKKKKINMNKFLFRNRQCISFAIVLLILIFSMLGTLDVFAEGSLSNVVTADVVDYGGNGDYTLNGTLATHFDLSSPYSALTRSNMTSSYTGNVNNLKWALNSAFPSTLNDVLTLGDYSPSSNYGYVVPVSVTANGSTLSLNTGAYYLGSYSWNSASSQKFFYNYRFWSSGDLCFIETSDANGYFVVSNQPIQYIWTRGMAYFDDIVTVGLGEWSTQSDNGLYCYALNDSPLEIPFTDLPIYIPSTGGDTGFTSFTPTTTDFTFSGNNYNFNSLLRDSVVVDPNGGGGHVDSEIERVSKSSMIFTSSDSWNGSALEGMTHTYNFNPNDYMRLHGEQFQIVVEHSAVYKDSTMNTVVDFTFPTYSIKVDMLLAQSNNGSFTIPLDLHNMKDTNGTSIRQYLLSTINTLTGTSTDYIDINSMGTESGNSGANGGNLISGGQYGDYIEDENGRRMYLDKPSNSKIVLRPEYDNTVEQFKLYSKIYVRTAPPDYNYESDSNDTSYNLVDGNYNIEKNGSSTQLYPPEDGSGVTTPTIPNGNTGTGTSVRVSGGGISNILKDLANALSYAIVESGAIQNTVSPSQTAYGGTIESGAVTVQTGGGGFQITNQDWNEYGGLVEEMATDMTNLQSGNGVTSFMGTIENAYECLPTKIWTLVFAGVSGSVVIGLWKKGSHCH